VKISRFTEAEVVAILKELEAGTATTELAPRHGFHANTIRQWLHKYAGLETNDLAQIKQLETERVHERIG
jgi:putative transposase